MSHYRRFPDWLRRSLATQSTQGTQAVLREHHLHTVCESAACPNRDECYSNRTATFMILGNTCTRRCGFCAVKHGSGEKLDFGEPYRVARAAKDLKLNYIVVTSVTRDDLSDEGAGHFAETVRATKTEIPQARVEVLTPDFHARQELIEIVSASGPEVFNHNLETVERLQREVRPQADYRRSLTTLEIARRLAPRRKTKSGLMLGLGETEAEVMQAGRDLLSAGVSLLTLGQYLQPAPENLEVRRYVAPEEFQLLAKRLEAMGFEKVFAGPYIRSSYHAQETFLQSKRSNNL